MLIRVDVFGSSDVLQLPIGGDDEPIQIKEITGLEPVKAAISSSPYGIGSGVAITGTSIADRNIVMTFGLNPDWATQTMEELRMLLYTYFMPQLPIKLGFVATHVDFVTIEGVVESIDPNMFSKDPEVQVSIICPRPEFIASDPTIVSGVVDTDTTTNLITYEGTADVGVVFRVDPSAFRGAYTGMITVAVTNPDSTVQKIIVDNVSIDYSRSLEISSVPGSKYVRIPSTPPVSLLNQMRNGYSWPIIKPGQNNLAVWGDLPGQLWSASFYPMYGGL